MFQGGPAPINPSSPPPGEDVAEWRAIVKFGGAGDEPDTAERQRMRYRAAGAEEGREEEGLEFSPGLSRYVLRTGPDLVVVAGLDYTIRTYDARRDFRRVQIFEGHSMAVNCVETYQGRWLISASDDMTIRKWRLGDEEYAELELTIWIAKQPIKTICALPGHRVACGGLDKKLRIVSLATGATLHIITGHKDEGPNSNFMQKEGCGAVFCLLHVRGNVLCSGADDSTIRFWDVDTARCFGTHVGHPGYQADIGEGGYRRFQFTREFAPVWRLCHLGGDGMRIASASYDRTVSIWDVSDVRNAKVVLNWLAGDNTILYVTAISEKHLATCGSDKQVKFWNWETGELTTKTWTRGSACAVSMLDDRTVAIGGGDATLRVFDWVEEKDLKGEHGFYAMDFIITSMCRVFFEDANDTHWLREPILYQTVHRSAGEEDAKEALELHRYMLEEAMNFQEID